MEFRSSSPVAGRAREFGGDDVGERQENGEREGETETERERRRERDGQRAAICVVLRRDVSVGADHGR